MSSKSDLRGAGWCACLASMVPRSPRRACAFPHAAPPAEKACAEALGFKFQR